jgi:Nose resistant-to-fluoxetine protein, N-terminal domain
MCMRTMVQFRLRVSILILLCLHHFASTAPSLQCSQDIVDYFAGITPTNPKLWALKSKNLFYFLRIDCLKTVIFCSVLDSSAKFPADGLFQGTFLMQMGHYDQCLATKGPADDDGGPRFTGKYCMVQVSFKAKENNTDARTELILAQMKIAFDLQNQTILEPGVANHMMHSQVDQKVHGLELWET